MVRKYGSLTITGLSLLGAATLSLAHGHGDDGSPDMGAHEHSNGLSSEMSSLPNISNSSVVAPPSYFTYPEHGHLILAHIGLMTIAWVFVLPIGVMLSIARSRLAVIVQLSFLGIHSIANLLGTIYAHNTPDLYEKNSHSRIGWVVTWVVVVQCVLEVVKLAVTISHRKHGKSEEESAFLSVTTRALEQHQHANHFTFPDEQDFSGGSARFVASDPPRSDSVSSTATFTQDEQQRLHEFDADEDEGIGFKSQTNGSLLGGEQIERAASGIASRISLRALRILDLLHNVINRTVFVLGFVTCVSGLAVYGGVFHGIEIFNGVAHTVKGGIFFWYGLLTLGRWMGCFVEYGWAWNIRPPMGVVSARQARVPSAEFVESFVIWLYGASNIFLEHLAAWGKPWSPMDLEHLSITIMFFGGGLCGMLIESTQVRRLLNSVILISPAGRGPQHVRERLQPPKTYAHPMNPIPGLVILLLGLMMSAHHQESMFSTMIHKQWGTLFVGFALARTVTYLITFISPPTSYLPSRPPSELIASFCLISGGLIFMASNRDTVTSMEAHEIHAMFPFTVTMGLTAFLMAWTITVLAVKGWALRRTSCTTRSTFSEQRMD